MNAFGDSLGAAVFDMDGLLIDSEPLWRAAETEVFGRIGVTLTDAMCAETMGFRIDEVVAHWHRRFGWDSKSLKGVEEEILAAVERLIRADARPLPGAIETVDSLVKRKMKLGLASSSPYAIIRHVIESLGVADHFEVLCSAMDEVKGKPDPAVYIRAASLLNFAPAQCVAFEDSVSGVRAAKAAGMFTVAVPAPDQYDSPDFDGADVKLRSLTDFSFDAMGV